MSATSFFTQTDSSRTAGLQENSTWAQYESAFQFWTVALELDAETMPFDRNFAQEEIARYQATLAQLSPTPSTHRVRTRSSLF
ncbi:MAG TPA: hypothetical protein VFN11_06270 [Ktedonobacterales bacterium]|nr:hypothetical protein [Ktedonobacterales bacterium]